MRIGVLLYTYNRIDDARINLEIIRGVWSKNALFKDVIIVHAFNGDKKWWPEKYLEDDLVYVKNPGHFKGAELLLNKGMERFSHKHRDVDYVITLASDTWCVKPDYLEKIIKTMRAKEKYIATCPWGMKSANNIFDIGAALDFNIIDIRWAFRYGLYPLRYQEFLNKYNEFFLYKNDTVFLERVFILRFIEAIVKSIHIPSENIIRKIAKDHIYEMVEREPVHRARWGRIMYWPKIGLITHHDPTPKQKALRVWKVSLGKFGNQFLKAKNLSYYNSGLTRISYIKNGKNINYGD